MEEEMMPILLNLTTIPFKKAPRSHYYVLLVVAGIAVTPVLIIIMKLCLGDSTSVSFNSVQSHQSTTNINVLPSHLQSECKENYFTQTLDHFDVGAPTYQQRYFVCDRHFQSNGVLFFYVGNEADVELYLNHTGLMWENAKEFSAMLVFAEHRYFGKSVPFGDEMIKHMKYLSTEQALADYAVLILHLKNIWMYDIPVIGFGGSYGGMLGSWLRMKYPHVVDGVIASSAPILSFLGDVGTLDKGSFARLVTFDASKRAGSAPLCAANIRRTWSVMKTLARSEKGRNQLKEALSLCEVVKVESTKDIARVMIWAKSAFDYMAMGNYPYPSSYIMNGVSVLPPYPVRVACSYVADDFAADDEIGLLSAFSKSLGVYYNSTKDQKCFELTASSNASAQNSNFWDYLFCSEMYQPQNVDGVTDMFWPIPWNFTADKELCRSKWRVDIRPLWATIQYGGRKALKVASNIVFSNGNYDPWSGTGVLQNYSNSVVALSVEGGAHHLDLMFSNKLDTPSVLAVRKVEKQYMHNWVREFYERKAVLASE
ncbi:hypothetical protein CCR75_006162 [Bremia lactucae]|uniref:Lysosomal Pro-X carboxypeptidase n=1 Tax=Bremia lactucae TaxID=4779 RepID=A0A976IKI9_BRELC|nr:hypothetical protein CCR75_006162 [Bremia lactucae]